MYYRVVERGNNHFTVESRPFWWPFWRREEISVYQGSEYRDCTSWTTPQGAVNALATLKQRRRCNEVIRLQEGGRFFPRVIHQERVSRSGWALTLMS